jgi:hypothetical protein
MDWLKWLRAEWAVLRNAPATFFVLFCLGLVIGFGVSEYHYSGRIDALKETLETRQFPPPTVQHIPVPVTDANSASVIANLNRRLDLASQTIQELVDVARSKTSIVPKTKPQSALPGATSSTNQSGGVLMGASGTIGTVNQNALPARSAFAAPLGQLYTEGYVIEQKVGGAGTTDAIIDDYRHQTELWQSKVVGFMNAHMCSDAAAYFLQTHRVSLDYSGMSQKQSGLFDVIGRSLDNLSDIKRNDAWDCK